MPFRHELMRLPCRYDEPPPAAMPSVIAISDIYFRALMF